MQTAKTAPAAGQSDKAPFWERFKAWWNGYELEEARRKFIAVQTADPSHDVRYEAPKLHWETARLRLVQEVWGEGFSSPGGAEHILNMVKFFGLDPAMSVLDLGAGLGGATRAMSQQFGVWVTGLEASKELAEAGMALSVKAGMAKKAAISNFDPATFEHKPKSIDCVFSKEFFFTVADKPEFLRAVENTMKPRGQLLFTDYVLAKPGQHSKALSKWSEFEPNPPHAWAAQDYQDALAAIHLDIRVVEDHTKQFYRMVTRAWADYIVQLQKRGVSSEDAGALVNEVELWARRMQAIEAGDLKVCRIHALKRDTNRLLSAW